MKFRSQLYIGKADILSYESSPRYITPYFLKFSRNKIHFTEEVIKKVNGISGTLYPMEEKYGIRHTDTYTLVRLEDDDVDRMKGSKFQIKLQSGATFNIASGGWDGIKMRWMHKRYSVQQHWEWYWKTILALLFGATITYFFTKTSYKAGYKDGLMEGRNSQFETKPSTNPPSK